VKIAHLQMMDKINGYTIYIVLHLHVILLYR